MKDKIREFFHRRSMRPLDAMLDDLAALFEKESAYIRELLEINKAKEKEYEKPTNPFNYISHKLPDY